MSGQSDGGVPRRKGVPAWAVALAAAAVLTPLGFLAGRAVSGGRAPPVVSASVGGPFTLVDDNGRPVDQSILKGRWSAVFFGYTFCPDTCPATLETLAAAQRRLGPMGDRLQVVFISVDPERDTPAQMKAYLSSQGFPKGAVGLTGTPAQVARAARAYGVYYARSGSGPDYTVDHSAAIYLMNPQGRFDRPLSHEMSPVLIAQQIRDAEAAS